MPKGLVFLNHGRIMHAGCKRYTVFPDQIGLIVCYSDNAFGRIFEFEVPGDLSNLTVESCIAACAAQNYTIAGMEFAVCPYASVK